MPSDAPVRAFVRERDRDRARIRCRDPRRPPPAGSRGRATRCTNSSVSGRGTSTAAVDLEIQRPELAASEKIGDGYARRRADGSLPRNRQPRPPAPLRPGRPGVASGSCASSGRAGFPRHGGRSCARRLRAAVRCRTGRAWGSDDTSSVPHRYHAVHVPRATPGCARRVAVAGSAAHDGRGAGRGVPAVSRRHASAACRTPGSWCSCSSYRHCIPRFSCRPAVHRGS